MPKKSNDENDQLGLQDLAKRIDEIGDDAALKTDDDAASRDNSESETSSEEPDATPPEDEG